MASSRRQFIWSSALMFALSESKLLAEQVSEHSGSALHIDSRVANFWASQVRNPYEEFVQGSGAKGGHFPAPEEPIFLMLSSDDSLQLANTTSADTLPDSGSPGVLLSVRRFRPSEADKQQLQAFGTGSLRIDFKQVTNQPGIPDALAWSAMSSILAGRTSNCLTFENLTSIPEPRGANSRR
ncbi:MAG TPA: hypothetical protein VMU26_00510 [Candidatus Polarisedimenticolia bacterium]|nr:hypothetical protein [Candidatus Polarisedimenticolia bacterium]